MKKVVNEISGEVQRSHSYLLHIYGCIVFNKWEIKGFKLR